MSIRNPKKTVGSIWSQKIELSFQTDSGTSAMTIWRYCTKRMSSQVLVICEKKARSLPFGTCFMESLVAYLKVSLILLRGHPMVTLIRRKQQQHYDFVWMAFGKLCTVFPKIMDLNISGTPKKIIVAKVHCLGNSVQKWTEVTRRRYDWLTYIRRF